VPDDEPRLVHAAPGELTTTRNVRADLKLDEAFVESVRVHGVLVPIVATRTDDGALAVEYGHRRAAAAVRAGLATVPVVVVPANGETARVAAQMVENQHRAALSVVDIAVAHDQLAMLGVPLSEAARLTATDTKQVGAFRRLAQGPRTALEQMDLESALALSEAETDEEAEQLQELFERRGKHSMLRQIEQWRGERQIRDAMAAATQEWTAKGYQVVDPEAEGAAALTSLAGPDGRRIEPEDHEDCPGRAVALNSYWGDDIRVRQLCVDPEANGHAWAEWVLKSREKEAAAQSPSAQEEKKRQRANVIERNKQWRAAEPVRRRHIKDWLEGASPTPAMVRWAYQEYLGRGLGLEPHALAGKLDEWLWKGSLVSSQAAAKRYGTSRLVVNPRLSKDRAVVGLVGLLLADREARTDVQSWRQPSAESDTGRYLLFLQEHTGYRLGEVERIAAGQPGQDIADMDPAENEPVRDRAAEPDATSAAKPRAAARLAEADLPDEQAHASSAQDAARASGEIGDGDYDDPADDEEYGVEVDYYEDVPADPAIAR
jgi:ParB family chromosome partitioning protein